MIFRRPDPLNHPTRFPPGALQVVPPWKVYGDIWRQHSLTRGALDKLVQSGVVPWTTGRNLLEGLTTAEEVRRFANLAEVRDAAERLGATPRWFHSTLEDAAKWKVSPEMAAHWHHLESLHEILPDALYYDISGYLARSAAVMLSPPPSEDLLDSPEAEVRRRASEELELRRALDLGKTKATAHLRVCPKCGAEVPEAIFAEALRAGVRAYGARVGSPASLEAAAVAAESLSCPVCAAAAAARAGQP